MARIYEISAYRTGDAPRDESPRTRNQELLAEINAMWEGRTPEQILMAELQGTEEELQAVQRRYARLLEAKSRLLSAGQIADGLEPKEQSRDQRETEADQDGKSGTHRNEVPRDRFPHREPPDQGRERGRGR
jgi:hypothetical protein